MYHSCSVLFGLHTFLYNTAHSLLFICTWYIYFLAPLLNSSCRLRYLLPYYRSHKCIYVSTYVLVYLRMHVHMYVLCMYVYMYHTTLQMGFTTHSSVKRIIIWYGFIYYLCGTEVTRTLFFCLYSGHESEVVVCLHSKH